MKKNHGLKNYTFIVIVFAISIIVIGISASYSFFTVNFDGSKTVPENQAPQFKVTSTLETASAIDAAQLALINGANYKTEAEKVNFSVTNSTESQVKAKYTISLEEMSISKNLVSKYFKWALVVNDGAEGNRVFTGDFTDSSISSEGNNDTTLVTGLSKVLIDDDNTLLLDIGKTDNLTFYIWLENDDSVDQLYLTNGNFSGKLSMNAIPTD